ncbi:MAG: SPOR domain-containing protein [Bacteroidota bacterium]
MKKLFVVLLILGSLIMSNVYAQKVGTREYRNLFNKALKHIHDEEYRFALGIFQALDKENQENANIEYHIGICLMDMRYDKEEPLEWFKKATRNTSMNPKPSPDELTAPLKVFYLIGECYQYGANYTEAKKWYQDFIDRADTQKLSLLVIDAKEKVEWCDNMKSLLPPDISKLEKNPDLKRNEEYFTKITDALEIVSLDHFKALSILNPLLEKDPFNYNLNYHVGVCCLNIKEFRSKAAMYLERACENIDVRHYKKLPRAIAAPVLANYYLGLVYCTENNSEKGIANYRIFLKNISANDPYKTAVVDKKIEECTPKNLPLDSASLAIVVDTTSFVTVEDTAVTNMNKNKVGPRAGYYFAVQVGAGNIKKTYFDQLATLDSNNNLIQSKGKSDKMRRWIIGKFKTPEEAAPLLKKVRETGYKDAFINEFQEMEIQQ